MTEERFIKEGALQARRDPAPTPPGQGSGTPTNPITGRTAVTAPAGQAPPAVVSSQSSGSRR